MDKKLRCSDDKKINDSILKKVKIYAKKRLTFFFINDIMLELSGGKARGTVHIEA